MNKTINSIIALIVIVLLGFALFTFTVQQGQTALKLRLGELVTNKAGQPKLYKPGLHFKIPFVNNIRYFDMRLQGLSADSSRIYTEEQKSVLVDYYAKWRIADLALYYKRTGGNPDRATLLLTQKINDVLRAAIGKRTLSDVVANDRAAIMDLLDKQARQSASSLGVNVVDVRIQGIELPQEVNDAVYTRMRTQREQVAAQYRSEGKAKGESIMADADADVVIQIAQAKAKAQQIRANGDRKSAIIYLTAYNKDPQFYAFYRSLNAYENVFHDKNNIMVLKPNSEFFRYFNMRNSTESKKT